MSPFSRHTQHTQQEILYVFCGLGWGLVPGVGDRILLAFYLYCQSVNASWIPQSWDEETGS